MATRRWAELISFSGCLHLLTMSLQQPLQFFDLSCPRGFWKVPECLQACTAPILARPFRILLASISVNL
jgi:hypothetical protein